MCEVRITYVAVVGSIIVDLAVRTPRIPAVGESLLAECLTMCPGGKGAKQRLPWLVPAAMEFWSAASGATTPGEWS